MEAVHNHYRGTLVDVQLQLDTANGKLLSFIETHSAVLAVISGQQNADHRPHRQKTLADLMRNDQVEVVKQMND